MSDELLDLLARTGAGDRAAFAQLYERTAGRLYAVSYQLLQRKESAEEAVQDAYIKVWHNAAGFQADKGSVMAWMVSIVRYGSLDLLKAQKVRGERGSAAAGASEEAASDDRSATPDYQFSHDRARAKIDHCLETLESRQRSAIALAYFQGLTHAEVCEHMAEPQGTVKSWIRRGLDHLKRCLER